MKNKSVIILVVVIIILLAGTALVFLRGDEDSWICDNGQWVKHGQPAAPAPTTGCGAAVGPASSMVEKGASFITGQREIDGLPVYTYSIEKIGLKFESNYSDMPLRFENNNMYVFEEKRPSVEFFDMSNGVTYLTVINNLINIFGKNPGNCRIVTSSGLYSSPDAVSTSSEIVWAKIEPIKEYQPTSADVNDYLKKSYPSSTAKELKVMLADTPEGDWAALVIKSQHTENDCGQYAKCYGYKCLSQFFYDSKNVPARLFYLYDAGGGDFNFYSGNDIAALQN